VAEVDLPQRNIPKHTLLRIRVPEGWKVASAQVGAERLDLDDKGTVDLSMLRGRQTIRFQIAEQ
jgi:hypothetical protein